MPEITSEELEKHVEEFKARGGKITHLPPEPDKNESYYTVKQKFRFDTNTLKDGTSSQYSNLMDDYVNTYAIYHQTEEDPDLCQDLESDS